MGKRNLFEKVWDAHTVRELPSGQTQLFVGLHLIHEVTSPQAFQMLRERGLRVMHPERTWATVDHIIPTDISDRPFLDDLAERMMVAMEENASEFEIPLFGMDDPRRGIVHVIGPELGLTQPGMTIACGDSHTSTHGAFGAVAFGIGTSQVRDVLASQCLAMSRPKVRRVSVDGTLGPGVYAKDLTLHVIGSLGVKGGVGYAYEYAGGVLDRMSMEERMTVCNMSIEGGARCGYVNPDETTFEYLQGRPEAPRGTPTSTAPSTGGAPSPPTPAPTTTTSWRSTPRPRSPPPSPGASTRGSPCSVDGSLPAPGEAGRPTPGRLQEALDFMGFEAGPAYRGRPRSTSPSSARAPTRASPIFARLRRWSRGERPPPT